MGRFFGGLGGGISSGKFGGNKSTISNTANSADKIIAAKNAMAEKKIGELSSEERYKKMVDKKLNEHKERLMSQQKMNNIKLPGTRSEVKEMSKSTMEAMKKILEKQAKKQEKAISNVTVKPQGIGGAYGGYIDAKGRITNSFGQQVMQIDLKTGDIKTTGLLGRKIGKYNPKSGSCFTKISKQLQNFAIKNGQAGNNIWGAPNSPTQSGGIYGNSGNIWGNSDNNGGGGLGW